MPRPALGRRRREDGEYARQEGPTAQRTARSRRSPNCSRVLGIDGALYASSRRTVTIHTGLARPNPDYASEEVLRTWA